MGTSHAQLATGEIKVEKDVVFKAILEEFDKPGTQFVLYKEAENYRLDLALKDLVDQVTNITLKRRFNKYYRPLKNSYQNGEDNFISWYQELKRLTRTDSKFKKAVNKVKFQIYTKSSIALAPNYKLFSVNKLLNNTLLKRIIKYNKVANDPEATGLLMAHSLVEVSPYYTKGLTVAKYKKIKR